MNTKTSILMAKARRPLGCGVRKFGILLTVMVAAIIALPNTVTNDVVVATSDAELRISDRGLGLGLEVVGGGAAEVKLETRPGWRFRDGSTSVTLNKAAGEPAKSPAIEGEGNGAENYVPGVDVNDDESGGDENDEGSVDHEKPVLSLTATAPKVVAYSVLDGGTNVSISLSATVTTKGKHRKLDANGNVVKEEEFSPKRYVWKMTGAATGEAETDSASHTFTVNLTKGKGKKLDFSVVGKICSICDGDVESDEAEDSIEIDVYELSISRPDYLGLDRTDAGRQGHVVKTATLSSDPSLPSSSSVEWKECGICEFVGAKNQLTVSYQNKDSETASGEYLAERLAASVTLAGMDSSVACATNFTVVKVDVEIADVKEDAEEVSGANIRYVHDAKGGTPTMVWTSLLGKVSIICRPKELPKNESLTITAPEMSLYARHEGKYYKVKHVQTIPISDISKIEFCLHGHSVSSLLCDKSVMTEHKNSNAKDVANFTNYGLELITPAGDPVNNPKDSGDGQNEFTFSKALPGVLVMNLKAKAFPCPKEGNGGGRFRVSAIGDSIMTWDAANPDGEATISGNILSAKVSFEGLPAHNSDFGRKIASVSCEGIGCDTNEYEVFFDKLTKNHPFVKNECSANWFYYWKEGGVCGIPEDCIYSGVAMVIKLEGEDISPVHLTDYSAGENSSKEFTSNIPGFGAIRAGGCGKGIQCVAEIVQHELHHTYFSLRYGAECQASPDADPDGDGIPTSAEPTEDGIATSPTCPDTYNVFSVFPILDYNKYGDNEIRCRRIEEKLVIKIFPKLDWANPGCQSKIPFGPTPE